MNKDQFKTAFSIKFEGILKSVTKDETTSAFIRTSVINNFNDFVDVTKLRPLYKTASKKARQQKMKALQQEIQKKNIELQKLQEEEKENNHEEGDKKPENLSHQEIQNENKELPKLQEENNDEQGDKKRENLSYQEDLFDDEGDANISQVVEMVLEEGPDESMHVEDESAVNAEIDSVSEI